MNNLTIIEDFISPEEEKELLNFIYSQKWLSSLSRRVQHYGYEYNYKPPYDLSPAPPIPDIFKKYSIEPSFNQVIVNEYLPGQGIGKHTDHKRLFGEKIVSISLGSPTTMIFRKNIQEETFYVKPRTLLLMEGDCRWNWTHEIPARKSDKVDGKIIHRETRVSLTFRTVISP